jgi:integrase
MRFSVARPIHKLSAVEVAKTTERGLHSDGGGLYLRVGPTGAKSWIFRFMVAGQAHDMGLGAFHTVALAEARDLAREARKKRLAGNNPIEVRAYERRQKTEVKNLSFEECTERYIDANKAGWKWKEAEKVFHQMFRKHVYPVVGSRAKDTPSPMTAREIDRAIVLKVLTPIWYDHPKRASEIRWRMEKVLAWARVNEYRDGENPARWKENLQPDLPSPKKVRRPIPHPALRSYADIAAVFALLGQKEDDWLGARAGQFTILVALRTDAVRGAEWEEFDFNENVWTVPAVRLKDLGRDLRVPLSTPAIELLQELEGTREGKFVFPGRNGHKCIGESRMLGVLKDIEWKENLTIHGFRASFGTWARDSKENFREDVIEMALAHKVGNATYEAYQRGDLFDHRRGIMDHWATVVVPQGGKASSTAA